MEIASVARVSLPNARKYVAQLVKHWSHRFVVTDTGIGVSIIDFGASRCRIACEADLVILEIEAPGDELEALERVVAEHLDRMAFRESPLAFDWRRTA